MKARLALMVLLCCCVATYCVWMITLSGHVRYRNGLDIKGFASYASPKENRSSDLPVQNVIQERNEERKQRIKRLCGQKECLAPKTLGSLLVDEEYKVMYCYVPKVACTQWKSFFAALKGKFPKPGRSIHYMPKGTFKFLSSYSVRERAEMLRTYYKFLFVREPMERLLSAYKDKFSENSKDAAFKRNWSKYVVAFMKKENATRTDFNISFRDFLGFVASDKVWQEHWDLVERMCQPCAIDYNFIGHFENMEEEASYVISASGMNETVPFAKYTPSNTTSRMFEAYSKIPPNLIIKVAKLYQSDFELFGYPFPGRLKVFLDKYDISI